MLVLSRKLNEEILIGDRVTLKVLDVRRGRVKIGIDAPADVRVQRKEQVDNQAHVKEKT
jgi:carbon storage regulator